MEVVSAYENLMKFCKPVKLYKILHARSLKHGILHHLLSSHDIFDYKFWYPAKNHPQVDVFLKPDAFEFWEKENDNAKMYKKIPFGFCSKRRKIRQRRARKNMKQPNEDSMELDLGDSPHAAENKLSNVKDGNMRRPNVDSLELDLNELPHVTENELSNVNNGKISPEKTSEIQTTNEPGIGKSSIPKKVLLATRRRKLAAERSEDKRVTRLQSRPFYHSQNAQPMSLKEVLSDADSEGEPDDDDANLKERLWLNQLVNVSDEDKQFMHLWNKFVRKQRVIADGHVPWACEEFTKLYGKDLNGSQSFFCIIT
ncbi:unnamed protein product [Arabis nemorensis]|uniref:Polycomb protein VEFS-Box domain-containing protein n=1 Tax=Arabis nemorensis TaxID=586526 RepID=A0A565BLL9_9BRAS|nr:unnamed protein product [Arabis nemorensis]